MAQTGYTPIQLYYSSTTTNVPLAANLANGELAINITDGKLFYKDNAAAVQVIAWKTTPTSAGGTGLTSYTAGDTLYYASGTTLTKLAIGAADYVMTSSGSVPQWSQFLKATAGGTGQTSYAVGDILYASTTTALSKLADVATGNALISGGIGVAPLYGKIGLTTHVSGTLPTANGGTNLTSFTANGMVYASSTSALATGSAITFDGTNFATTGSATATSFIPSGSNVPTNGLYLPASNQIAWSTNSTYRGRFDSSGNFMIGATAQVASGFVTLQFANNVRNGIVFDDTDVGAGTSAAVIFRRNTSQIGSITTTAVATAYVTTSDYRVKHNPQPLTESGAFIDALEPKTWDWSNGFGKGVGFIAHEVQSVSPTSVMGQKDAIDNEGNPIMQGMEYGSAEFIANIIAELKSLRIRVAQIEAKG
jgi:hypothetical protein